MNSKLSIMQSAATSNPCLVILREKGYELEVLDMIDNDTVLYTACKDGRQFGAHSGPGLLGLVTLWEHLGDEWLEKLPTMPDILADVIKEVRDEE